MISIYKYGRIKNGRVDKAIEIRIENKELASIIDKDL